MKTIHRRCHRVNPATLRLGAALVVAVAALSPAAPPEAEPISVVRSFARRVTVAEARLPTILSSAATAAARTIECPQMLINVPYAAQPGFAEEILNRAGGLANALPHIERRSLVTKHDVSLIAIRSWDEDRATLLPILREHKAQGWMVVVFASAAGMPDDLDVDVLIDNGARTGDSSEGSVNAIANVLNGWLWICEYAAALTRSGRHPGVLQSIFVEGNLEHNARLQRGDRRALGSTDRAVPAGDLARAYLARVARVVKDVSSEKTLAEVETAAAVIADHIRTGGTVKLATCLHLLMSEIYKDTRAPFVPFHGYRGAGKVFAKNLAEGDLLVYFAYVGMTTPYEDYGGAIAKTGVPLVSSYVTDVDPAKNLPKAMAHIEQHWTLPDAELAVSFPPGAMAPVSGIDQGLLFRLLDAAVARHLGL